MTSIEDLVGRLQVVLEAEEDVYRRFKSVLRREEEELIELDPAALERTTGEKQALAAEARLHEEGRVELSLRLGALLGADGQPPKLSLLISLLGDEASELAELHARLAALVDATRSLLASNENFAQRSLVRVQDTLRLLGQSIPEPSGYGPGTNAGARTGRGRLVRAAI